MPNAAGTIVTTSVATGPIVGLTAANSDYTSTDLTRSSPISARPPRAGSRRTPGYSGIQGSDGELLIGGGSTPVNLTGSGSIDNLALGAVTTPFRRFESIAFDQYGYFSQSVKLTPTASTTTAGPARPPSQWPMRNRSYGGSLFVSDLASGLYVTVTPTGSLSTTATIIIPVQGSGPIGVTTDASGNVIPIINQRQHDCWVQRLRRPDHPRSAQRNGEYVRLWIRHQRGPGLHQLRQLDADHQLLGGWDDALRF